MRTPARPAPLALAAALLTLLLLALAGPAAARAATGGAQQVACTGPGACTAVGTLAGADGAQQGLLLAETGGVWQPQELAALPAGAAASPVVLLNSLWCGRGPNCVAVGDYQDGGGDQQALVLSDHAGVWSRGIKLTLPAGAIAGGNQLAELNAVWCASAGNCVAVGDYTDHDDVQQGLTVTEVNGVWQRASASPLPGDAATSPAVVLTALSCATTTRCTAVGVYSDAEGNQDGLVLVGHPGSWAYGQVVLPSDAAPAAQQVQLNALACASGDHCAAVGTFIDEGGNQQPLVLVDDADSVSTLQPALPANAASSGGPAAQLTSVACPAVGDCTAVGDYTDANGAEQGLLVSETAGTFSPGTELTLPAGAAANPGVTLQALNCTAPGQCEAAGGYASGSGAQLPIIATEQAGAWGAATAPALPAGAVAGGAQTALLDGLDCVGSTCAAVGSFSGRQGPEPLVVSGTPSGRFATAREPAAPATAAQIDAALSRLLRAAGPASLRRLAHHPLSIRFSAPARGRVQLVWRAGATPLARTTAVNVTRVGTVRLRLSLTAAGRARLTGRGLPAVGASASFTPLAPAGSPPVTVSVRPQR